MALILKIMITSFLIQLLTSHKSKEFNFHTKDNLLIHRFDRGLILKDCEILKVIQMILLIVNKKKSDQTIDLLTVF